jgi:hypothetical protein
MAIYQIEKEVLMKILTPTSQIKPANDFFTSKEEDLCQNERAEMVFCGGILFVLDSKAEILFYKQRVQAMRGKNPRVGIVFFGATQQEAEEIKDKGQMMHYVNGELVPFSS